MVSPGIRTSELSDAAIPLLAERGFTTNLRGLGFPAPIAVSVSNVAAHGVPGERLLEPGDLVTIDCAAQRAGFWADCAITVCAGDPSDSARTVLLASQAATEAGCLVLAEGGGIADVSRAVREAAAAWGCVVLPVCAGHGIGRDLHQAPVSPYLPYDAGSGERPQGVMTVEPVVASGPCELTVLEDGWSLVTRPTVLTAQTEHMVLCGAGDSAILTGYPSPGSGARTAGQR